MQRWQRRYRVRGLLTAVENSRQSETPKPRQPRAVLRAIWAIHPSRAAIQGGATGSEI